MFVAGANSAGGGGYTLENSLRFRSSASAYLNRTNATSGDNDKIFTISAWVKRGTISGGANFKTWFGSQTGTNAFTFLGFNSSDQLVWRIRNSSSVDLTEMTTTQVFRDSSAWYHIVLQFDSTESTALDRDKLWVNGEQITSFSTSNTTALNGTPTGTTLTNPQIGRTYTNASTNYYTDQYLTEYNFVDGQALDPTYFGEYNEDTGVWQPIEYEGTYGTNGFYLKGRGTDNSGNGNDFTENNFNTTTSTATTYDIMTDVPTLTDEDTSNFCVMNPLDLANTSTVMSDGNLKVSHTGAAWNADRATMGVSSGKWYWEVTVNVVGFTFAGGVMKTELSILNNTFPGNSSYPSGSSFGYYFTGGKYGAGLVNAAYGAAYTNGDVIGTALDLDAGTITFYKNNISQGVAFTGLSGEFAPATGLYSTSNHDVNFGQRPFAYTPPTGYLKLNTFNLPDSAIVNGSEYMNTVTYTGNATYPRTIDGFGFQPDFVWFKARSAAYGHFLFDVIRGVGNTNFLTSNSAAAEGVNSTNANIDSFDSDGYIIDTPSSTDTQNASGLTTVSWGWKAGGTAVSNTDGTITSSVSANPTAGFSVVTYTANGIQTIGHGLGVAPRMVIVKSTSTATGWLVGHEDIGFSKFMFLNTTAAASTNATVWNNTSPTASVFTLGSGVTTATYGDMVAYCFADVEGYSKFGSYTGNGSANGPFVYTGFRPAFVMVKRTDGGTANWYVLDSARNTYNLTNTMLFPNLSAAEVSTTEDNQDFLSNGFKLRTSNNESNINGGTYIYMAFAENPFKNSLAR